MSCRICEIGLLHHFVALIYQQLSTITPLYSLPMALRKQLFVSLHSEHHPLPSIVLHHHMYSPNYINRL